MNKFDVKFEEIADRFKNDPTDEERQELNREFFANAVACFNEEIAGPVTLADGRVITINTI